MQHLDRNSWNATAKCVVHTAEYIEIDMCKEWRCVRKEKERERVSSYKSLVFDVTGKWSFSSLNCDLHKRIKPGDRSRARRERETEKENRNEHYKTYRNFILSFLYFIRELSCCLTWTPFLLFMEIGRFLKYALLAFSFYLSLVRSILF